MASRGNIRLGEMLVEQGVITRDQLNTALAMQGTGNKRLGQMLVSLGYANEKAILSALTKIAAHDNASDKTDGSSHSKRFPIKPFHIKCGLLATAFVLTITAYCLFFALPKDQGAAPVLQASAAISDSSESEVQEEAASSAIPESVEQVEETQLFDAVDSYIESDDVTDIALSEVVVEAETSSDYGFDDSETSYELVSEVVATDLEPETYYEAELGPVDQIDSLEDSTQELAVQSVAPVSFITGVRTSSSSKDMRIVFESSDPISPAVERIYLNDTEVLYIFQGFSFAEDVNKQRSMTNNAWLVQSHFEQTDGNLVWAFTMANAGTAKYHQLPANQERGYRFVVVVRKN